MLVHPSKVVFLNLNSDETIEKFQVLKKYSQEDNIDAYSNVCSKLYEPENPVKLPTISNKF